jgi:hypothetical protein
VAFPSNRSIIFWEHGCTENRKQTCNFQITIGAQLLETLFVLLFRTRYKPSLCLVKEHATSVSSMSKTTMAPLKPNFRCGLFVRMRRFAVGVLFKEGIAEIRSDAGKSHCSCVQSVRKAPQAVVNQRLLCTPPAF